jgi:aspartate kinase
LSIVVQKYGGSSVADVDRIRIVAERVTRTKRAGHDVVVVVSAMGDTTDDLLSLAKKVSPNPDRRELDMLLSAGERISMALLSLAIRELGGDAISFTGSQSGIITNDRHVDARIIEVRPFRVRSTARSAPTWMAFTPPIHGSFPMRAGLACSRTKRRRSLPNRAPGS